jgi:hypothetical protein
LKLHIGVIDVPELDSDVTTYQVATMLEKEYGLFSAYYDMNSQNIANYIADGVAGAFETYELTGTFANMPLQDAGDQIAADFQDYIDQHRFDHVLQGVPTKAAQIGIRRRFKDRLDPGRPSFQDTGTMEASLKAWFE